MSENLIEFYVGVSMDEIEECRGIISARCAISSEFDSDHYSFTVLGTWDDYEFFLNSSWVKSIEHFMDDV